MAKKPKPDAWRNRIIGHGEEAPDQLLANPANWRIHPKAQQDALAGVLSQVGWVQDVIVNQQTGHVVDGHLRVSLAISRKEPSIPVVYVDLSPEEEALVLATLDPLAAMAAADKEKLDTLLREVSTGDAALQQMLSELAAQNPFGDTATDRDGQGVSSTWDQVEATDNQRVIIGPIETRLPLDVVETLGRTLTAAYEQRRIPIYDTLEAVIVAGVRAVETSDS